MRLDPCMFVHVAHQTLLLTEACSTFRAQKPFLCALRLTMSLPTVDESVLLENVLERKRSVTFTAHVWFGITV